MRTGLIMSVNGERLFEDRPDALDAFENSAVNAVDDRLPNNLPDYLDHGDFATVFTVPGSDDLVYKIATPYSGSQVPPKPIRAAARGALHAEFRLLDSLQHNLDRRGYPQDVYVPRQYALKRFAGGTALLMERVTGATTYDEAHHHTNSSVKIDQNELISRIDTALSDTPLRFAVNDIVKHYPKEIRSKNILLKPLSESEQLQIWLIDCMTPGIVGRSKARFAGLLTKLVGSIEP